MLPVDLTDERRGAAPGRLSHLPALDGLRGLAVAVVLLFHGRVSWASGGFLGVTSFFVLSGFLITGLLLAERDATGRIDLKHFWVRRARRLAPAILVLLGVVIAYVKWGATRTIDGIFGDAVAALLWVSNWRFVLEEQSYAQMFSAPTPFQHVWSLAVEEQFYLVFPLLAILALGTTGAPRRGLFAGIAVAGIAASTWAAVALHPAGSPPGRSYFGTDTRMAEPLVGVLLALLLVTPAGRRELSRAMRRVLDVAALASLAGLAWMVHGLTERSDSLYRGGFLGAAVMTAVVVAAVTQPGSLIARLFSVAPLRGLGLVSYGVYLYHWPIFLWLTSRRTGLDGWSLLALRCAVTAGVAFVSYVVVEQPIRQGRLPGRVALLGWVPAGTGLLAALALIVVVPVAAPSTSDVAMAQSTDRAAVAVTTTTLLRSDVARSAGAAAAPTTTVAAAVRPQQTTTTKPRRATDAGEAFTPPSRFSEAPPLPPFDPDAVRIAVVGDSMALGLGRGLESWAKDRGGVSIYNLSITACPLSSGGGQRRAANGDDFGISPQCAWWSDPASERAAKLVEFDPDVVILQDGMNEVFDRRLPDWREFRRPGELQFDSWIMEEYGKMADFFVGVGAKLRVLNAVCADWETMGPFGAELAEGNDGDRRIAALNRTTAQLIRLDVQNVDFHAHLCPNGRYSTTVDGVRDARPDGYHLSPEAEVAVAERWLGPLALEAAGG